MSTQEAFGSLLRELRLAKSLTIEALADASGVSVRGIGDLERGRRAAPQRRTVAALADGLGLDDTERERLLVAARPQPRIQPCRGAVLPRGAEDFVGRADELAELDKLAGGAPDDDSGADPGPRPPGPSSSSSTARPEPARPPSPCVPPASWPTASRTASSWWTCGAPTTPRPPSRS
ncbi:helix-turn-helix domain-containing protein [Streptomyces nogalater]